MSVNDVDKFNKDLEKFAANSKTITQVIIATTGVKVTYPGIKTETITQGIFTHFELMDGRMILVNPDNVFCIEVMK